MESFMSPSFIHGGDDSGFKPSKKRDIDSEQDRMVIRDSLRHIDQAEESLKTLEKILQHKTDDESEFNRT